MFGRRARKEAIVNHSRMCEIAVESESILILEKQNFELIMSSTKTFYAMLIIILSTDNVLAAINNFCSEYCCDFQNLGVKTSASCWDCCGSGVVVLSCWEELGVQMLAFCFCCNSWCKWLLESSSSLSASGFNRLYPGCGRSFCLGFCVYVK